MDLLGKLAVLAIAVIVIWGVWRASQPRAVFVVGVRDGKTQVTTGTVTPAFLQQIRDVMSSHTVKKATVFGLIRGPRISLRFSRGVPQEARQQLRNWWAVSGWSPPRIRA